MNDYGTHKGFQALVPNEKYYINKKDYKMPEEDEYKKGKPYNVYTEFQRLIAVRNSFKNKFDKMDFIESEINDYEVSRI